MSESGKAQWRHVETIHEMEGVVDVEWEDDLRVVIHRDVREAVRTVLSRQGYSGEISFEEIPDDMDAVLDRQQKFLNNFDLYLIPSSRRADLAEFGIPLDNPIYDADRPLWNAVDETMREQGITREHIQEMRRTHPNIDEDPAYRGILLPLFRALRKRGFSVVTLRG